MRRKLYDKLHKHLLKKEFTILVGARQTGKSTLLKSLHESLINDNHSTIFLNLERSEILQDLNDSPENVFKYLPQNIERSFVFIDEVQYLDDPSNFLKLLYDEYVDKIKIIATGSSAFYIDKNFNDSLAGRKKIFEISTLDFEEFLMFKNENALLQEVVLLRDRKLSKSIHEQRLLALFDEYMIYGGYPAVVLEQDFEDKKERLAELKDSFIKKDILESGVNNELKFYELMILLSSQSGNLVNINELSKSLKIAATTVENYLYILQKCFHIQFIRPYYGNIKKELVKMPKAYYRDLGMRNCLINYYEPITNRVDKGALFENLVFILINNKYKKEEIKFWRTSEGNEVDFVIDNAINSKAFEVKYSDKEIKQSKYKIFKENYPNCDLEFVTSNLAHLIQFL
jgi:uncharacterized protein